MSSARALGVLVSPHSHAESATHALARVAALVASDGAARPLLFEERHGAPGFELRLAGDGDLLRPIARILEEACVGGIRVPPGPAHLPPAHPFRGAFGVFEPAAQTDSAKPAAPFQIPYPAPPKELWWALQGHLRRSDGGTLELWLRTMVVGPPQSSPLEELRPSLLQRALGAGFPGLEVRTISAGRTEKREWIRGGADRFRSIFPIRPSAEEVGRLFAGGLAGSGAEPMPARHTIVFGASGSGKSRFLRAATVDRIRRGEPTILIDVHGTLAPEVLAELDSGGRSAVVAIDPTAEGPVPGFALLSATDPTRQEAERAQLLAAFARLHAREGESYWGFRLDRILDSFLALVQEEGGDFRDLAALLTDPRRREAARLRTRTPRLARFLDELPDLVRRNPEFLWPATSRLGRLLGSPRLMDLVAPRGLPVSVPAVLESGRSLFLRLPMGTLGPEGAEDVATLLLARIFLDLTTPRPAGGSPPGVLLVLDEAHRLSGALLAEMLAEGRKFGFGVLAATQYPERLDRTARAAAQGAVVRHLLFRLPRVLASEAGRWVGLDPESAGRILPALGSGEFVELSAGSSSLPVLGLVREATPIGASDRGWREALDQSRAEYASTEEPAEADLDLRDERLLLGLFALGGPQTPVPRAAIEQWMAEALDTDSAGEGIAERLVLFGHRGWTESIGSGTLLTLAGREALGIVSRTGASRESSEHRALLVAAARIFARHGHVLELLRQGRYDTQLPDARFRQISAPGVAPAHLARQVDRARAGWAWRAFHGQDVHVEAEVSGAQRPVRIRHGLQKAGRAGAFALFLVSDAKRARKVRSVLHEERTVPRRAAVWTLPIAGSATPAEPPASGRPGPALLPLGEDRFATERRAAHGEQRQHEQGQDAREDQEGVRVEREELDLAQDVQRREREEHQRPELLSGPDVGRDRGDEDVHLDAHEPGERDHEEEARHVPARIQQVAELGAGERVDERHEDPRTEERRPDRGKEGGERLPEEDLAVGRRGREERLQAPLHLLPHDGIGGEARREHRRQQDEEERERVGQGNERGVGATPLPHDGRDHGREPDRDDEGEHHERVQDRLLAPEHREVLPGDRPRLREVHDPSRTNRR